MEFWESGLVLNALLLALLLLGGGALRMLPGIRQLGIPGAILGGCLGLALGSSGLGVLSLDIKALESIVYHGLAIVFTAVALQTPRRAATPAGAGSGRRGGGAVSIAILVPVFLCLQAALGLGLAMALGIHPGFGMLLALGFEQGPGQALSMGSSWEASGLVDGGQVGLIMAAIGFGWSIVVGVPLTAWGRRRGLAADLSQFPDPVLPPDAVQRAALAHDEPGALEVLSRQAAAIGVAYLLTWLLVSQVAGAFAEAGKDGLAHTAWGFHFIFGALFGMLLRVVIRRLPVASPLDDRVLGQIAGFTVDVVTCASIAAVQLAVLSANLMPILLITTAGGVVTLLAVVWLSARAFPIAPFEHCVMVFGMVTGTLPMGLSLLRTLDPELRSPASINAVTGSAITVPLVALFLMGLMPLAIDTWAQGYPGSAALPLAALVGYLAVLLVAWRLLGPLRFSAPTRLWAVPSDTPPVETAAP